MARIGALGCLRAGPVDQQTVSSPESFVVMGHRFLEIEPCAGIDVPMLVEGRMPTPAIHSCALELDLGTGTPRARNVEDLQQACRLAHMVGVC